MLFAMEGIPAVYIQNLVGAVNDFKKFKNTNANRSVNRTNWNYIKLCNLIEKSSSLNNKIYSSIIKLIKLRIKQPAFHPNATQFTLQLQSYLFGVWRQSIDRSQSIFCISNLSKQNKSVSLLDINLISTDKWHDILTKKDIKDLSGNMILSPYQTVWLTNKNYE